MSCHEYAHQQQMIEIGIQGRGSCFMEKEKNFVKSPALKMTTRALDSSGLKVGYRPWPSRRSSRRLNSLREKQDIMFVTH